MFKIKKGNLPVEIICKKVLHILHETLHKAPESIYLSHE